MVQCLSYACDAAHGLALFLSFQSHCRTKTGPQPSSSALFQTNITHPPPTARHLTQLLLHSFDSLEIFFCGRIIIVIILINKMRVIQGTWLIIATSSLLLLAQAFVPDLKSPKATQKLFVASSIITSEQTHVVDGMVCRTIPLKVPTVGTVTILEATAQSQEDLVDMACALEEDDPDAQLLSAGDPCGAVLWPAAWAVARYILESKAVKLSETSVLELGTGTGLVSLALALGGAKNVLATDYEPLALHLTNYAAETFHPNGTQGLETRLLDMCDYDDKLPKVDLVVAADVMYEPKTGVAMAHRAVEALKNGARVIVGDSPGRPGRAAFLQTLKELGVEGAEFVDTIGRRRTGSWKDFIRSKASMSEAPKDLSVAIMDLKPEHLTK